LAVPLANVPLPLRFSFKAMGSPCELQVFASSGDARRVADAAIAEMERLEARYSRYRSESFLSEINRAGQAGGRIAVDDETAALLDYAQACYAESDGLFDITSGVLRRAWGRFDGNVLPDGATIAPLLAVVGWHKLSWSRPHLAFGVRGMEIDFGGVVKEFAADRLATLCREHGIESGVVNLGGDIRIIGPRADGLPWQVGIQHPRDRGVVAQTVAMHGGALASSGDYERCIEVAGVRYGHILNPKTGWPVRRMAAVSVVADFCVVAGSAATIAMLKEDDGPAWLVQLGLAHLWIDVDGARGGPLAAATG
jgi:thiamine biosynthesis lipoprotein